MKEDLKKLRDMDKDGVNSQANIVKSVEDENNLFLAINDVVVKTKWVWILLPQRTFVQIERCLTL